MSKNVEEVGTNLEDLGEAYRGIERGQDTSYIPQFSKALVMVLWTNPYLETPCTDVKESWVLGCAFQEKQSKEARKPHSFISQGTASFIEVARTDPPHLLVLWLWLTKEGAAALSRESVLALPVNAGTRMD